MVTCRVTSDYYGFPLDLARFLGFRCDWFGRFRVALFTSDSRVWMLFGGGVVFERFLGFVCDGFGRFRGREFLERFVWFGWEN